MTFDEKVTLLQITAGGRDVSDNTSFMLVQPNVDLKDYKSYQCAFASKRVLATASRPTQRTGTNDFDCYIYSTESYSAHNVSSCWPNVRDICT